MPTLAVKITTGKKLTEDMYSQAATEENPEEIRLWNTSA